jgi:hypothetical protein
MDVVHVEREGVPAARDLTHLVVAQQDLAAHGGRDRLGGSRRVGARNAGDQTGVPRVPMGQVDTLGIAAGSLQRGRVDLDQVRACALDGAFTMIADDDGHLIVGAPERALISAAGGLSTARARSNKALSASSFSPLVWSRRRMASRKAARVSALTSKRSTCFSSSGRGGVVGWSPRARPDTSFSTSRLQPPSAASSKD